LRRLAENTENRTEEKADESCARRTLGPWLVATVVLICGAIALAFYHREDMRAARSSAPPMRLGPVQPRMGWESTNMRTMAARQAVFVPPWHGQQNPDAVTGATPKRASFNRAIEIVSPSVVGINTSGTTKQGASGIVVHPRGYILTNYHVANGAEGIVVTLIHDQLIKSYPGGLVRAKPELDLALLKISSRKGEVFTPAPLGNSDKIYVGQDVVAIGNPFGLTQSASAGIISNPNRSLTAGQTVLDGLIQTDAPINPGSSGGALVNAVGEVIGINTAIYSPVEGFTGVSFAVPINQAKTAFGEYIQMTRSPLVGGNALGRGGTMKQADFPDMGVNLQFVANRASGPASRCWLGIDVCPVNQILTREFTVPFDNGVLVNRVFANSPAGKAGLQRGDVIYRVNNRRVRDPQMAWSALAEGKSGDKVKVTLFRNGSRKVVYLTLAPEPANIRSLLSEAPQGLAAAEIEGIEEISWIGIDIQPLEVGEATQEFGVDPNQTGVFVGEVEGIAAIEAGLQPGDVIKKVNNQAVRDIDAFKDVIVRVDPSEGVLLDVVRQDRPFYITIKAGGGDLGAWQ